jgi:hypothetical protein
MCEPACEAESQGRGLGHMTLWCGTCSVRATGRPGSTSHRTRSGRHRPLSG